MVRAANGSSELAVRFPVRPYLDSQSTPQQLSSEKGDNVIAYEDFIPQQTSGPGFFTSAEYESFDEALKAANSFVVGRELNVLNVETVVLPNVWNEEGTTDASIRTSGDVSATWHQFIRVWYKR
ncbi:MAG: hypothetical protein ACI92S_005049 [Planctomycetaceae bacterium]|jgi:hypothetical protein